MKLVIVESPSKAKTIEKYLGSDFKVVASFGHIRDLETTGSTDLGVDIENNFLPKYVISKDKTKVIRTLQEACKNAEEVYLASDPDREGEAIAWHLADVLGLDVNTTKRLEFHEVTKKAIIEAIENPRNINMDLVSSQEARRITDRIIGFRLSNLVQRKLKARSAGRVQSVALKLIIERQKEIDAFQEEISYGLSGKVINVKEDDSLGKIIEIEHDKDFISIYQSLSEVSVKKDDIVNQGQVIGTSGTNELDKELGNHLHFELLYKGNIVNPEEHLNKEI